MVTGSLLPTDCPVILHHRPCRKSLATLGGPQGNHWHFRRLTCRGDRGAGNSRDVALEQVSHVGVSTPDLPPAIFKARPQDSAISSLG